jgi:hypothetical protein
LKKYLSLLFVVLLLIGCSNDGEVKVIESQELSFEEKIIEVMKANEVEFDLIIDYDLKSDSIFVVYDMLGANGLHVALIQQTNSGLEWIGDQDATTTISTISNEELFVTIVRPRDEDYKEVKVLGKHAKLVTYYNNSFGDVTIEEKYWIAFTDKNPILSINDIELIKE